ncbi:MAG: PD40 domain-containing protein [Acidobacteria bacterium]|nr:PD40 domain-containing protein [Acidobacteriota bacterium]
MPKALEMLLVLVSNKERVLDKDELMQLLWPDTIVEEANLTQNIYRLRKALGESPDEHLYIVTVPGRGYRFVADVKKVSDPTADLIVEEHNRTVIEQLEVEDESESGEAGGYPAQAGSVRDVGFHLDGLLETPLSPAAAPVAVPGRARRRERLGWIVATIALMTTLGLALAYFRRGQVEVRTVRSVVLLPENSSLTGRVGTAIPVISPDGTRLVFLATIGGRRLLWVRSLDSLSVQALEGTEGARTPFWSPDGNFIGFVKNKRLMKIGASGGPQITLCDVQSESRGAAWNREGTIIFAPSTGSPLYRVSDSGGVPSPVTTLDEARGVVSHYWPCFLPDGRHFLYLGKANADYESDGDALYVASLDSTESRLVLKTNYNALYAQGYLLFIREGALMAQAFDSERMETVGAASPVAEQVGYSPLGHGFYSVSENGVLAYVMDQVKDSQLTWFDRTGKPVGMLGDEALQGDPSLSPDGKWVMVTLLDPKTGNRDLWRYELARGLRTRFTFDPAEERGPVWSPDGSRIVFASNRAGHFDVYQKAFNGTGGEEPLLENDSFKMTFSWSSDGRFLLFRPFDPKTNWNLWILSMSGDRQVSPFSQTEFYEMGGMFSPDGRWIAFQSNESGRVEVYVAPFPTAGVEKRQISLAGGKWPRWRGDGREIFYLDRDEKLMAAAVGFKGTNVEVGTVVPLFQTRPSSPGYSGYAYDVTPDGQRFLINTAIEPITSPSITLVTNWAVDLKK